MNKPNKLTTPVYNRKVKTKVKNNRLARKMFPEHNVISPETIEIIEYKVMFGIEAFLAKYDDMVNHKREKGNK